MTDVVKAATPTPGDQPRPATRSSSVASDRWVLRFGRTERFAHWWTVVMFGSALLSGLAMGDETNGGPLLTLHVASVVMIGAGVVVAFVIGDRRAMLRSMGQLLVFDRRDAAWMLSRFRHPLHRAPHAQWGQFNTGQKLLAWGMGISLVALILTGVQSASSGGDARGPHAAAASLIVVLLGAHVFMAVVNPATRPALPGMVFGRVRRSWAATHHGAWLRDVDKGSPPKP